MAIYLARDLRGESAQSLGAYFGGISGAGITMRYKRMSERASQSRRLRGRVKKIRSQIVNTEDSSMLMESQSPYSTVFAPEKDGLSDENTWFWDVYSEKTKY